MVRLARERIVRRWGEHRPEIVGVADVNQRSVARDSQRENITPSIAALFEQADGVAHQVHRL